MKVNPKSYYAANDYTSSKQENKPKKAETGYAAFAEKLKKRDEEQNLIQNVKKELNKETHEIEMATPKIEKPKTEEQNTPKAPTKDNSHFSYYS